MKMKNIVFAAVAAALPMLAMSGSAFSASYDVGNFVSNCRENQPQAHARCAQFVAGVLAGYVIGQERGAPRTICPPGGVDADTQLQHVLDFMHDHPRAQNGDLAHVIIRAYEHGWPC